MPEMSEAEGKKIMIKVFYGENRVKALEEVRKFLGEDYEVVEGSELTPGDLPSLMLGNSLFSEERKILIRDVSANKVVWEELSKYLKTPHKVAILELKIDKRSSAYKTLKDEVEFREFVMPRDLNAGLVFDIYRVAKKDGKKAMEMLEKVKAEQDPMMFLGLMASQAIKDYNMRPGTKEKKALKELSKLDMNLKSTKLSPWLLIQAFLLQLSSW